MEEVKGNTEMKLNRSFYTCGVLEASEKLLGKILVHRTKEGITKGRIVELEAYNGAIDKAAHSYPNRCTERTKIQFGEGGYAYIYFIYGMYYCMNIVTGRSNEPESVLLRALEPVEGIELMKKRRGTDKLRNLCNGPGKLCQAMGLPRSSTEWICAEIFCIWRMQSPLSRKIFCGRSGLMWTMLKRQRIICGDIS